MSSTTWDPTLPSTATVRAGDGPAAPETLPTLSVDLRAAVEGTAPTSESDLEVRGVIGEGGMGRVLLAHQRSLSRDVAVKTAKSEASEATRRALLAEGALTGRLEHPAIVPVHALGLDPSGWPALVMKRIEGVSWEGLLADPGHPGWEGWEGDEANRLAGHLQLLTQVCNALHFAHSKGVVHRDVKPQNVLIGRFGDVYLADWGVAVAKGSAHAQVAGTPAFLAPEMATGGVVDERTDVYLLGATLHVVLTGAPRHPGPTVTDSLLQARSSAPFEYAASVPAELAALANRACHPDPAQRPASARAFRDEVLQYVRHRDARALAEQAQRRVVELEGLALHAIDGRERVERLLNEARFGLEQSLAQCADNDAARAALAKVEAMLEARRRRAVELEHEARERDPRPGARWRTLSLGGMTLLALAAAVPAWLHHGPTPQSWLVFFPAAVAAGIGGGALVLRDRLLDTRFNRQVFATVMLGMSMMVALRALALVLPTPAAEQFVRDSFVQAAVMGVCAIAFLRWVAVVAVLFAATGVACSLFPEWSMNLFSGATVLAMLVALAASWADERHRAQPPG